MPAEEMPGQSSSLVGELRRVFGGRCEVRVECGAGTLGRGKDVHVHSAGLGGDGDLELLLESLLKEALGLFLGGVFGQGEGEIVASGFGGGEFDAARVDGVDLGDEGAEIVAAGGPVI